MLHRRWSLRPRQGPSFLLTKKGGKDVPKGSSPLRYPSFCAAGAPFATLTSAQRHKLRRTAHSKPQRRFALKISLRKIFLNLYRYAMCRRFGAINYLPDTGTSWVEFCCAPRCLRSLRSPPAMGARYPKGQFLSENRSGTAKSLPCVKGGGSPNGDSEGLSNPPPEAVCENFSTENFLH